MKILVLPDIHGRTFWRTAVERADSCDRVVFLGDYLDPYGFEGIAVSDAVENFREIIGFAKQHPGKVVMLLGNHDMPYYSDDYRALASYHCRWSREWHDVIKGAFDENRSLFRMAHVEDDVLFTHAGCSSRWLKSLGVEPASLSELVAALNALPSTAQGLRQLFMVSSWRGGMDDAGSCVWADVHEMVNDYEGLSFAHCQVVKQVFGHTQQVGYDSTGNIVSRKPITTPTMKMLDTRCAYLLDTSTFTHEALPL